MSELKLKLVPVESTDAMRQAGHKVPGAPHMADGALSDIWSAMLGASPLSIVQPGTTVLWRTDRRPTIDEIQEMTKYLPPGASQLIALERNESIEALDDDAMRAAGWVRQRPVNYLGNSES